MKRIAGFAAILAVALLASVPARALEVTPPATVGQTQPVNLEVPSGVTGTSQASTVDANALIGRYTGIYKASNGFIRGTVLEITAVNGNLVQCRLMTDPTVGNSCSGAMLCQGTLNSSSLEIIAQREIRGCEQIKATLVVSEGARKLAGRETNLGWEITLRK